MSHRNARLTVHGRLLLQTEWAYRQVFATNQARTDAFAPWLEHYNSHREPPRLRHR